MTYIRNIKHFAFLTTLTLNIATAHSENITDLSVMSFESLGKIVTSVSKKPEKAFKAAAAIYVITQEDLRASGATSIPEALRMVPGVHVARNDSKSWSITSRGFNDDGFGNKLLVLIDGRSVYTPLFSGVYWDAQDTLMEDIERIEVIRGPGASLWGANAVNGVINIITKSAKHTQGHYLSVGGGNHERAFIGARKGGNIGDNFFYRTYVKRFNRNSTKTIDGEDGGNDWYQTRSGFKTEWHKDHNTNLTVQGDFYEGRHDLTLFVPTTTVAEYRDDSLGVMGGNVLARWSHQRDDATQTMVQAYYDMTQNKYSLFKQDIHTLDIEMQHSMRWNPSNELIMGAGYRYIFDELQGTEIISYEPDHQGITLASAFLQNSYSIIPNELVLTLGSKFEHNDYTGFEVQPNIRMQWTPNDSHTLWGSVARAVRTPNRSERDLSLAVLSGFIRWEENDYSESEELTAYEIGYRVSPSPNITWDASIFFNDYDSLRTREIMTEDVPTDSVLAFQFDNKAYAESYGIEIANKWDVNDYWTLKSSYSLLAIDIHLDPDSTSIDGENDEGTVPKSKFNVLSTLYLPNNIELNNSLYFVDNITSFDLPRYFRFDSRIGWKPKTGISLELVGQNLFNDAHQEGAAALHGVANEIGKSIFGKATFRF